MIPRLYETCRNQLVPKLAAVEYVALTTDVWTSDTNSSFVSITGHYVYNNTLSSSVLETKQLVENHTGANIASAIAEVLENYSISSKVVTVVADNAANMKNAIEEHLKLPYQPCVAHTLNMVSEDAVSVSETLKDIVKKCRSLVGHFKSSTISTAKLQQAQDQLGLPQLKVKQDIKVPLAVALANISNPPEALLPSKWETIEECVPLLKPMEDMTTELSRELYPTLSMVIPMLRGLQYTISSKKACFLDPRFKKAGFGLEANAKQAEDRVLSELQSLLSKKKTSTAPTPRITASKSSIWDIFDAKIELCKGTETPSSSSMILLRQYKELSHLPRQQNPMEFWSLQSTLPELA
ncbi:hypothetical protein JTE90_018163 [Oedothorax gibbosus]|uniref:Zinc finger BED domain-containing protein 1 n=1 Tax=Oedothorax gibbosus TaxID=931172 RepID=A0AAV6U9N5_9ARAC|nr:hypothetical protein JTE90_018163 [Oedothorax gibbosus]